MLQYGNHLTAGTLEGNCLSIVSWLLYKSHLNSPRSLLHLLHLGRPGNMLRAGTGRAARVQHGQQLQASMPLPLPALQLASQQLASHQMASQASLWAEQ